MTARAPSAPDNLLAAQARVGPVGARTPASGFPPLSRAYAMLAILVVAYMLALIDRQLLALMVGPVRAALGITDFQISLLQGFAFAIFYGVLGIPLGRFADRTNRKYLIAAGIFVWCLATAACGLAGSFATLFMARVWVGIGEATLAPAGYSLIADSFPPSHSVRASAIFSMGAMLGGGLALIIGGTALDLAGAVSRYVAGGAWAPWQLVFIGIGAPGILLSALIVVAVREPPRREHQVLPLGQGFGYLWQMRRYYGPYYATAALLAMMTFANLSWLPTHFIRVFEMTPGQAGLRLGIAMILGCFVGSLFGTALFERFQRKGKADAHMRTVLAVSLLAIPPVLGPLLPRSDMAIVAVFLYFSMQNAYNGAIMAAMQRFTPNALRATNTALFFLTVNLMGLGLGTALVAWFSDNIFVGSARSIGESIALVCVVAAGLSAVIAALTLKRFREPQVCEPQLALIQIGTLQ